MDEKMRKQAVINIFKNNASELEDIPDDAKLIDLGINSITFIRIIVELESYFNFEFEDEDLDYKNFEYIDDVCRYIANKTERNYG